MDDYGMVWLYIAIWVYGYMAKLLRYGMAVYGYMVVYCYTVGLPYGYMAIWLWHGTFVYDNFIWKFSYEIVYGRPWGV